MGYIKHQAVVATFIDDDKVVHKELEALRQEMEGVLGLPNCILGPCVGINGYKTYVFAPDGSKEGWETSEQADMFRHRFKQAVLKAHHRDFVEIQFGGDDFETRVLETTDPKECS